MKKLILAMALVFMTMPFAMAENPCNPCSSGWGNPCNPCSMQPMNPCNPCATKHINPCNPCSMKKSINPCNPCASANTPIRKHAYDNFWEAASVGEKMWNDSNLGTSGLSCLDCHGGYELLNLDKNQNFPHYVGMVDDVVSLDQMINYCMLNPMKGKQFEKNSAELTAMAAFYRANRMKYIREKR